MKKYNEDFTTIPTEVYAGIKNATEELGCNPVLICRLTNHPDDDYLFVVVAQYINPHPIYGRIYCVWEANTSRNKVNLFYGHYGVSFKTALEIVSDKVRDLNKEEELV